MARPERWFEAGTPEKMARYESAKAARLFPIVFLVERGRGGLRRIPLPANKTVAQARADFMRGPHEQRSLLEGMA